jgi:hypothetical protein
MQNGTLAKESEIDKLHGAISGALAQIRTAVSDEIF